MATLMDCYAGAYGVTIRFDAESLDDLRTLGEAFRRLSMGETNEVALHRLEGLRVSNLEGLTISVVGVEPDISLRLLNGRTYLWLNTREGWERCYGLVDGLIEYNRPGHQYLTNEGIDDALVEVCLYERRNEASDEAV